MSALMNLKIKIKTILAAAFLLSSAGHGALGARTFTVKNNCPYTIWPGMFTDPAGTAKADFPTGWEAVAGSSVSFEVPDDWRAGRIWGRRDCDFSNPGPDGTTACKTGSCIGGLECIQPGIPPVTLAEWTLSGDGNQDWYDVSLVDGFNIPMAITTNMNCSVASCPTDLNPSCPPELAGPLDRSGVASGCKSACFANLDGNPQDSANCCSGSHSTPDTCSPGGVQYYDYFKDGCPLSYAYAYDESSGTALWTCDSKLGADYTITFCPSGTPHELVWTALEVFVRLINYLAREGGN